LYANISQFVKGSDSKKELFYPKDNGFVNKEELENCFKGIGFPIQGDEINAIFQDFGLDDPTSKLELRLLFDRLQCWKNPADKAKPDMINALNMELIDVRFISVIKQIKGFG
jgi:hypothetical protein